jgi:hypothetical protein
MSLFSEQRRHISVLLGAFDKIGIESESLAQRFLGRCFLLRHGIKERERVEFSALHVRWQIFLRHLVGPGLLELCRTPHLAAIKIELRKMLKQMPEAVAENDSPQGPAL